MDPDLTLHRLTESDKQQIDPWFDDPEVIRRLDTRLCICTFLATPGTETDDGMTVLSTHKWTARDPGGTPVAFIAGEVYDRWQPTGDFDAAASPADETPRRSMVLLYVVDPARHGFGYGRTTVKAVLACADVADVEDFYCPIAADHPASQGIALAAGFRFIGSSRGKTMRHYRYRR